MVCFFQNMVKFFISRDYIVWKMIFKIDKLILNILLPIRGKLNHGYGIDSESDVVVSLTSFPDRIRSVWVTVSTLLNQTSKPRKVVLWLAEEQFPERKLPKSLVKLKKRGLEIYFCEDLKPHKKYYYTMQKWPDYRVVIVDDDMFYPEDFIENLLEGAKKWPDSVICNRSRYITSIDNEILNYTSWGKKITSKPSNRIIPIGCDGVLYPPHCLDEKAFDKDRIMKLALYTDDLWLKCMCVLNHRKAINNNMLGLRFFNNIFTQSSGLWKDNVEGNRRNDDAWTNLMKYYPYVEECIIETLDK